MPSNTDCGHRHEGDTEHLRPLEGMVMVMLMIVVVFIVIVVIMVVVTLVIVLMAILFRAMSMRSRYRQPASRLFGEIGRRPIIVLRIHR